VFKFTLYYNSILKHKLTAKIVGDDNGIAIICSGRRKLLADSRSFAGGVMQLEAYLKEKK
jgi:hypothetical protein